MSKPIRTYIPNDDYDSLYKLVEQKIFHIETFHGDKQPTGFWIHNGRLVSQGKNDMYYKEVYPIRECVDEVEPASGMGKAIDYLAKKYNRKFHECIPPVLYFYTENSIPKSIELPQKILDQFRPPSTD